MKTLVLVEHEGGKVKDATLAAVTAASKLGEVHLLVAGQGVGGGRRGGGEDRRRRQGPCRRRRRLRPQSRRECRAADRLADGGPRRLPRARDHHRQERRAARRRPARRHADFRDPLRRERGHLHPADLCRQRDRHGEIVRCQEGDHRARHRLREGVGRGRLGRDRDRLRDRRMRACPASSAPSSPSRSGPS